MACSSCRGSRVGRTEVRDGRRTVGYDYTPPGGGESERFTDKVDALVARRKSGGGTVKAVYAG